MYKLYIVVPRPNGALSIHKHALVTFCREISPHIIYSYFSIFQLIVLTFAARTITVLIDVQNIALPTRAAKCFHQRALINLYQQLIVNIGC